MLRKIREISIHWERLYKQMHLSGGNLAIIVEIWDAHKLSQMFYLFLPPPPLAAPPLSKYGASPLFALGSGQPTPVYCCTDLVP